METLIDDGEPILKIVGKDIKEREAGKADRFSKQAVVSLLFSSERLE